MGRNHSRLAVWTLAVLTVFGIAGAPAAFADGNKPHVSGGGQFFLTDPVGPNGSDKVNIGIDGKYDKNGNPQGHLEYHNEFNGLHAHGKLASLSFLVMPSVTVPLVGDPVCSSNDPDACSCSFAAQQQGFDVSGSPAAKVSGTCDGNDNCTFSLMVVDNDPADGAKPKPKPIDFVCNVNVTGQGKMHSTFTDNDPGKPLVHGHIEIKGVAQQ